MKIIVSILDNFTISIKLLLLKPYNAINGKKYGVINNGLAK